MSVGPVFQGGMGASAVPHTEILAWASNTGLTFAGAEAEWINKMSAAYAGELSRSSDENTTSPYVCKDD